ncbi:MAG TPA: transposase [Isosphaeraceae bacterium]|nr:transposase [Isosphaeraceae bacterium]
MLEKYPTAERIAAAHLTSLEKIPYLSSERAREVQKAAKQSVASLRGPVAEALVTDLVRQLRHCQIAERSMQKLLTKAFAELPGSAHTQLQTIPGIGPATAAALVAKIVDIDRFDTPDKLVGYFGIFPEENRSGVDRFGNPLPPGTMCMSRKGCDLVRGYLWNATRVAICHNPAIRPLYRRLRAKGKRGDVAFGQCMRKLLHLVFAVWKTNRPFDANHYPWENPHNEVPEDLAASSVAATDSGNNKAKGHKQDKPAGEVVTSAHSTIEPTPPSVKPEHPPVAARPHIDFAFLRQQVSLEQVLAHLGLFDQLRGRGPQRRGCCPVHSHPGDQERTFSVHLAKNAFRCFQKDCAAQGNALDLWAAIHRLPLYDAALHLAETFGVPRNREEEPVKGTR